MMGTGVARNSVEADDMQNLLAPPGFVSRTAFSLKRITSSEDTQKHVPSKDASDSTQLSSRLEDYVLEVNSQIKHRAWIIHDQLDNLDHHEEESIDEQHHEIDPSSSEGCLPKGLIWGCSSCSNCVKVPAQWDPEGARSFQLEEAPVFHPTDEEFIDTHKYIESISQQLKPYGLCRIVPPPSWQPSCLKDDISEAYNFTTEVQRIDGFQRYGKRKRLKSTNVEESKRRRISKSDLDNEAEAGIHFGPHFTVKDFKKNADYAKERYFQEKSKGVNPKASSVEWGPSEVDIEGEYWRILEKPTAEIEVLRRANLDAESLRNRVLESVELETSNSTSYQDSGWNLSNLSRLPGSLLSFEKSDYLGDFAPQFHIGMCFSTLPWEVAEHHLCTLWCLHLGAPKIWYGVPGHYFIKFQAAVKKHFPTIVSPTPELLHKLALQVSPSTLRAEGIPVYRCIQRPKEFILFLPGAYHTGFDCGFNVSESACCAPLDWLPHGQTFTELYHGRKMKELVCHDKLLFKVAHEAVKARWEYLMKGSKTPATLRWKDACKKGGVIAETLKVRVKAEERLREFLSTDSQSRKMNHSLDKGERKECCVCKTILYLSAAFCPCNPNKYACLKHTKSLCLCAWSDKVFLLRLNTSAFNLLVEAIEGKFSSINKWVKENHGNALDYGTCSEVEVTSEDPFSIDKAPEYEAETGLSSPEGANVKENLSESESIMARILEASVGRFKSKLLLQDSDSSSESDDEKPVAECHSASNGQASGGSKAGHEKPETKSSGKPEPATIFLLSSDDEA